ncbi:MAG: hypothetical protein B6229_08040 [Spirochaetaceae bacterium 4572_7]|nr:MAG: hypothetical protein B6229_08040 [Spirochaetaceae bacterium 4572_7]
MKSKKLHLSSLMFFQFCVVGVFIPVFTLYLKDYLNFTGIQIGMILSVSSIPSILAPFISAWIVDKTITSRHFLILCQSGAAALILILSTQKNYYSVLFTYLLYMLMLVPTFALVNALIFHNSEDSGSFGAIRLWGTIGWIASGWLISFIWKHSNSTETMALGLKFSAVFSIIVIILTLKLPKLKLDKDKKVSIIPKEAIKIAIKPEVALLLFAVFLSSIADKFYVFGTPLFLQSINIAKDNIIIFMTLGQITEIVMLFALASIIKRLNFKSIVIIGLVIQITRFIIFFSNGPLIVNLIGISLNGFIYALFYVTATIYLDNFTDETSRGGIHQIFSLVSVGLAGLVGNYIAGIIANNPTATGNINFKFFWIIPTIISVTTLLIVIFFMKKIKE